MVSEFVVVWVELNWLRNVAGSAFFVKWDAREACAASPRRSPGDRQHTPHGLAFQNGRIGMADQELDEPSALCCVKI